MCTLIVGFGKFLLSTPYWCAKTPLIAQHILLVCLNTPKGVGVVEHRYKGVTEQHSFNSVTNK